MRKAARSLAALLCISSSVWVAAQDRPAPAVIPPAAIAPAIMPLDQIHEGMKGTALTVFQGVKPESMEVEVLGVMRNVNGPKGDVILVRLHGVKPEYTGGCARLPHRRVLEGTDRGGDADRGDAGDQCARS
jgi:hypothetical protein